MGNHAFIYFQEFPFGKYKMLLSQFNLTVMVPLGFCFSFLFSKTQTNAMRTGMCPCKQIAEKLQRGGLRLKLCQIS